MATTWTSARSTRTSCAELLLRVAAGGFLVLAGVLVYLAAPKGEGSPVTSSSPAGIASDIAKESQQAAATAPPTVTKPIEAVQVGERAAPKENPTEEFDDSLGHEVDPDTWRSVELRAPKQDGTWADVVLLRPAWWLEERNAQVGGTLGIVVPECGIDGHADVLAVGPCPPITPGKGRVIIGTFKHQSAAVVDIYVESLEDPIGVTTNHPFWSDDRQDFVPVGELHIGERLHGMTGSPRVTKIAARGPPEPVYNVEVHGEHVYQVTSSGLLVHNLPVGWCKDAKQYYRALLKDGRLDKSFAKALTRERFATGELADPRKIRFTQSSVGNTISTPNGTRPLRKLVKDLVGGRVSADDLPPIRVFERNGQLFTLDNRRLKAFQVAGKPVRTVQATADEVAAEAWKLTTKNGGVSVKVRGGGL